MKIKASRGFEIISVPFNGNVAEFLMDALSGKCGKPEPIKENYPTGVFGGK